MITQTAPVAKPPRPLIVREDDCRAPTTRQVKPPDADDAIAREVDHLMHHYGNDRSRVFAHLSDQKLPAEQMEQCLAALRGRFAGLRATPAAADASTHTYDACQSSSVPESQDCQESHDSHVAAAPKTARRRGARRKGRTQCPKADRKPSASTLAAGLAEELAEWDELPDSCRLYEFRVPFLLARRLRQLGDVDPERLRSVAISFWQETEDLDGGDIEFDEFWVAFPDCWDKVQFAEGEDPFSGAAARAQEAPLPADSFPSAECRAVASLAYYLTDYRQGEAVALPQGRIAEWLGCGQQYVSRILSLLVRQGVLAVADAEYVRGKKAKEYTFTMPGWRRWPRTGATG
jgi:hypothetical protein